MSLDKTQQTGLSIDDLKIMVKSTPVSYPEFLDIFQEMLLYVLDEVIFLLEIWIKSKVPKRTGQLQDSLLLTLYTSDVYGTTLNIELGTMLFYAGAVNDMPRVRVAHFNEAGYAYYYGHHGRILLNDPQAVGNFWDKLVIYSKERTMNILQRAIDEYFKGYGNLMRSIRGKL